MSDLKDMLATAEQAVRVGSQAVEQSERLVAELKASRDMCGRLANALTDAAGRAFLIAKELEKPAYSPSFLMDQAKTIVREVEQALKREKASVAE